MGKVDEVKLPAFIMTHFDYLPDIISKKNN